VKINEKQIQEWKETYGDVWKFPVDDKVCYLREPKMQDFKRAFGAMQKSGEVSFGEEMLSALWLGGDMEIRTNDDYFFPARKELTDFFNYPDAETTTLEGRQTEIQIEEHKCIVRVITREDLRIAEKKNPSNKPFVTQEKLFEMICVQRDEAFNDKNNASIRFPLYKAIEELQNQKVAILKKL
jgi:hypothetical protein